MMSSDPPPPKGGGGGGLGPVLLLLKDLEIPKFSGHPEKFLEWRVQIRRFLEIASMEKGNLPEAIKMELLARALDAKNKNILTAHQEKGKSFEEFLKVLDGVYMGDVQEFHRRKFMALEFPHPQKLTREEIREFAANYECLRNRVGDRAQEEEYFHLMSKLPSEWRRKIVQEEEKLNKEKFWLKVEKISGTAERAQMDFLAQRAGEYPIRAKEKDGHYLVQFQNEQAAARILALHGKKIGGRPFSVVKFRVKMTAMEMLEWIEAQLRVREMADGWDPAKNLHAFTKVDERQRSPSPKKIGV